VRIIFDTFLPLIILLWEQLIIMQSHCQAFTVIEVFDTLSVTKYRLRTIAHIQNQLGHRNHTPKERHAISAKPN
jgi:hypothetical protein